MWYFSTNPFCKGESQSVNFLIRAGYRITARNWRYGRYELDIIASKGAVLHFIEVKTATTDQFGLPEQRVNKKKFIHILCAARQYLLINNWQGRIQFDVLAVFLGSDTTDYFLLEDIWL